MLEKKSDVDFGESFIQGIKCLYLCICTHTHILNKGIGQDEKIMGVTAKKRDLKIEEFC